MTESLFFIQRYWGSDDEDSLNFGIESKTNDFHDVEASSFNKEKSEFFTNDSDIKNENKNMPYDIYPRKQIKDNTNVSSSLQTSINGTETSSKSGRLEKGKKRGKKKSEQSDGKKIKIKHYETEITSVQEISPNFCTIGQVKSQSNLKPKRVLPNWLGKPTIIGVDLQEENTPISELGYLDDNIKNNLKSAGIHYLFPVQLAVIPWLMQSSERCLLVRPSDLCVSAPTGSGKTLAFVIPIIQSLKNRVVCAVRAMVVLPVHELAIQVYKVFEHFTRGTDLKVILLTGQKSFNTEQNSLVKRGICEAQSLADIIVTTPGRVLDHINRTDGFSLKHLRYLVIDEADRMMEEIQQGWLKQIENAVRHYCNNVTCSCYYTKNERVYFDPSSACNYGFVTLPLQKLLYSATLSHDPEKLHSLSLYRPKLFTSVSRPKLNASVSTLDAEDEWIGKCPIPDSLTILHVVCDNEIKPMVVCHLIKQYGFSKVLCFTETVERAHRLNVVLAEMGLLQVREISSYSRPVQRKIVLEQFRTGKVNILICSDLVARGIDIENIDCVISYDVPQFVKTYIHRIGRTARAGKSGTAITLLSANETALFRKMLKSADIRAPEQVNINIKDLEIYASSFQQSLIAADAKLKEEKSTRNMLQKKKKKKGGTDKSFK